MVYSLLIRRMTNSEFCYFSNILWYIIGNTVDIFQCIVLGDWSYDISDYKLLLWFPSMRKIKNFYKNEYCFKNFCNQSFLDSLTNPREVVKFNIFSFRIHWFSLKKLSLFGSKCWIFLWGCSAANFLNPQTWDKSVIGPQ